MSVLEASQSSRLAALRAARDALAIQIDAGGGTVAQCVAQFRAVLAEISGIESEGGADPKGTVLSDFEQRLRDRSAKAAGRGKRTG